MATGSDLVSLAKTRIREKYDLGQKVPKNDPNWHGPWDCAELATWVVYQITGNQYGCTDNKKDPAHSEAYSGSWFSDAQKKILHKSTIEEALTTPGIILIRKPPPKWTKKSGHVAISNGLGGTIEAMDTAHGVAEGKIAGRCWHAFARIPGIEYISSPVELDVTGIDSSLCKLISAALGVKRFVKDAQRSLKMAGHYAGALDGEASSDVIAAVQDFQYENGLVPDGYLGLDTVLKLGIEFPKRLALTTGAKSKVITGKNLENVVLKPKQTMTLKAEDKSKKANTKAKKKVK